MSRTSILIGVVCMLGILESNCGGGADAGLPPPPPRLSIVTASLVDGMMTFSYSQSIQCAGGVAPFSWTVTSGNLPQSLALAVAARPIQPLSLSPLELLRSRA
jgi:hypothetical protein